MREIVIVIPDLYWAPEAPPDAELLSRLPALPGLELLTRFGESSRLEHGWRDWLARWLGQPGLAGEAPASIAAAAADVREADSVWLATPVHLVAGLTSLHLDRGGILRLPFGELEELARDFHRALGESGFALTALPSGDFLMRAPALAPVSTVEPARAMGLSLAQALPSGEGATVLRRLQAEVEMWLHEHPVNQARVRRGEPAVSALWPWGGGPLGPERQSPAGRAEDVLFAADAYAHGLFHLHGGQSRPLADTLRDVLGYAPAQRAAIIVEVGQMLQTHPGWTLPEALAEIDRRFVAPATSALRPGPLARLALVANDRLLRVLAADRSRWWRRRRPALEGLLK